ncbi:hypothetical protein UFOVP371_29 [uncultured Caudovirales phage]|uniref:Baseplate structural protein Gp10 C-terminal domain-containing protein n=1 Tax=uncultured Caudovirales phage TaxID=2100421 RepID=A0A6J7X0Q2_9CAUD|nr:hypothetical protein UFOVP371_29 [uncultured Caudovirales phage]
MTDYVKSTSFASKDALSTGNPAKIVKGTEIDTEFNNIATAVATKADITSPAFAGTPTAPTASAGTSNTQLSTTAFVQAAIALLYPVGSIYTNASVATNPGTLLGFGTWTAFGAGRVMVGFNSGNALFDTAEETGGSADAITVSHTHTATVTDPGHSHAGGAQSPIIFGSGSNPENKVPGQQNTSSAVTGISVTNSTTGSSGTNANYQPYITVYMWKRTA